MENKNILRLDEKDIAISCLLSRFLGISKSTSRILIFLLHVKKECNSLEIEYGARLRQPEVSMAMQTLKAKNWVTTRNIKNKGKGRPHHCYTLAITKHDIIDKYEKKKLDEIEKLKEDFEELKTFL